MTLALSGEYMDKIQKYVVNIILGLCYVNYDNAFETLTLIHW